MSKTILKEWDNVTLNNLIDIIEWVKKYTTVSIYLLLGSVGAGKTTFVREYLKSLGIFIFKGSPTYGYYHSYEKENHQEYIHMDLYRLTKNDESFQEEFEELQESSAIFFIENYYHATPFLLHSYIEIIFEEQTPHTRKIIIKG